MLRRFSPLLALCAGLMLTASLLADRTADQILEDLNAAKAPIPDRSKMRDAAYMREYRQQSMETTQKRAKLIGELFKVEPKHEQLGKLLPERWTALRYEGDAKAEIASVLANPPTPKLAQEAQFGNLQMVQNELFGALFQKRQEPSAELVKKVTKAAEGFAAKYPKDARAATGLLLLADYCMPNAADQHAIYKRVAEGFADNQALQRRLEGKLYQYEKVGKPFELSFTDAINNSTVSIAQLKGKVVVIDFWATWCGPCIKEMPTMKELYAKYKDKGVEFIGVSLDRSEADGGLKKLKDYVQKNEVKWPQYYQGNYWQSEFSSGWKINGIPAVFVVDQAGKLYSVNARGKIDKLVEELLAKAKPAT